MRSHTLTLIGLIAALTTLPAPCRAQVVGTNEWRYGTTLAVFGGAGSDGSSTHPAAGAALGWEIVPRFTLEGSGSWIGEGHGTRTFAALLAPRVNLLPPQRVVPFLSGGVGMVRSAYESGRGDIPGFYARRMAALPLATRQTFQDVAFSAGGGFDVFLRRHLALRPDVRVFFVRADSRTRTMALFGVHVAYHFEEHPITP
jgi:hypothetical protein